MNIAQQQLDELEVLAEEALQARRRLVVEACLRVKLAVERRIRPTADDAHVLQQYIAERQQQNRYGQ